ncbi:hypothetical protein HPB47_014941 [Ixodes persulcatus]|uniref:Uncharacterized protein n=1 Tax=Ixodes persulcatus TaxID=34615 RepID=A0AC60QUR3_IXOPE|nr:hypothetical protein HPB47_014941 [Ixodes persulcatus]
MSESSLNQWASSMRREARYYRQRAFGVVAEDEIPTVGKLAKRFELDDAMPFVTVVIMHRKLEKFGFKYKKRSRNALLIEATHIVAGHKVVTNVGQRIRHERVRKNALGSPRDCRTPRQGRKAGRDPLWQREQKQPRQGLLVKHGYHTSLGKGTSALAGILAGAQGKTFGPWVKKSPKREPRP